MKSDPARQQPVLVWMALRRTTRRRSGCSSIHPSSTPPATTTIDWFVPSPDGRKIAVSLSKGGTESGDAHVFDVATMKPIGEPHHARPRRHRRRLAGLERDGSGFWYTRYPREGERPAADLAFYQQVWFHQLGKPESTTARSSATSSPASPRWSSTPGGTASGSWRA